MIAVPGLPVSRTVQPRLTASQTALTSQSTRTCASNISTCNLGNRRFRVLALRSDLSVALRSNTPKSRRRPIAFASDPPHDAPHWTRAVLVTHSSALTLTRPTALRTEKRFPLWSLLERRADGGWKAHACTLYCLTRSGSTACSICRKFYKGSA